MSSALPIGPSAKDAHIAGKRVKVKRVKVNRKSKGKW